MPKTKSVRGGAAVVDEEAEGTRLFLYLLYLIFLAEEAAKFAKQMAELQTLFGDLGQRLHATPPVELTEEESAYQVVVVKHFFPAHVVFQYAVTNTLPEQELRNVSMDIGSDQGDFRLAFHLLTSSETGFEVVKVLPAKVCSFKSEASIYVTLTRHVCTSLSLAEFGIYFLLLSGGCFFYETIILQQYDVRHSRCEHANRRG